MPVHPHTTSRYPRRRLTRSSSSALMSVNHFGLLEPAHSKTTSGQRPPCSSLACCRAASDEAADVRSAEMLWMRWLGWA